MKDKSMYMIGNAHIDPVWLWQWQEGFQEVKATFRSALDRMKEYPDFMFTGSSAAYYEWVENNDPQMFREIKDRIKEGRWIIVGGWWIQPDCNIPCGESFVRQALYGQRYFKEKFGVTAVVGYNVDSFGHNGMLPQILKKSGLNYYVFMRPGPHEKELPGRLFQWESEDGSKVTAFRLPFAYCSWGEALKKHISMCAEEIKEPFKSIMCFYGVGNHGGGPTRENIELIKSMDGHDELPALKMASPDDYFKEVDGLELPVVHGELLHHASGCYSAHSGVKMWNRRAENCLIAAEKFCIMGNILCGQPYPKDFDRAWKNVLFNQFHDILAGTSIEPAYEDAKDMFSEAVSIGKRNMNYALQAVSWNINIEPMDGMKPIVVFNPHSFPCSAPVEFESWHIDKDYTLIDDQGSEIDRQFIQPNATTEWGKRFVFLAELPPMGYRVYRLVNRKSSMNSENMKCTNNTMDNGRYVLEFDEHTGCIKSLKNKDKSIEFFSSQGAKPVVIEDNSDTWSHGIRKFDNLIGEFTVKSIKLYECGPIKSTIRIESTYGSSTLIQHFTMYKELDRIDVKATIDWHEKHKMLKLKYPVNALDAKATFEIPYGLVQREMDGEEYPVQSWMDMTGLNDVKSETFGLSILNDGKYSCSSSNGEMMLTALRSPIYAHHEPKIPELESEYTYIDRGVQQFTYALYPHIGPMCFNTIKNAMLLNQKPYILQESYHNGSLPQNYSFVTIDGEGVVVGALKKAEDNDDIIIRLCETLKKNTRVKVFLPNLERCFEAEFRPCEIKTYRVSADEKNPIVETNFIEWKE